MKPYTLNHTSGGVASQQVQLRVIDLFAGVGGFRIGLEGYPRSQSGGYKVVWSNQWEPSTKVQHAAGIYEARFGKQDAHFNLDIAKVPTDAIPDHDLLVGGFPCQDYSVARTLSRAAGLEGKKGVLWWEIHRILKEKGSAKPRFLMLENVDRLLKSPALQRGRDFAVMLASLSDLGYVVEWRIINAADYGMPQRRRRIYILGYLADSEIGQSLSGNPDEWLTKNGVFAKAFSVESGFSTSTFELFGDLDEISRDFNRKVGAKTPFGSSGIMQRRKITTATVKADYHGPFTVLADVLQKDSEVSEEFFISDKDLKNWEYFKGAKQEKRITKDGFEYNYSEGGMVFPDALDKPSRTIVTGEGGATPSRFKHVIPTADGRHRRLTPLELERLNMFPDNHTVGAADVKRAFFMGNALVVGVIERLGKELMKRVEKVEARRDLAAV